MLTTAGGSRKGCLVPPFLSPDRMLPDRQVVSLLDQVIEQARSLYPDRRRGILRMGANSARALNFALSVTAPNILAIDREDIMTRVETMLDSEDDLAIGDITFVLALI